MAQEYRHSSSGRMKTSAGYKPGKVEVKQYPLHGRYIKKNMAIEIVEKGGVE